VPLMSKIVRLRVNRRMHLSEISDFDRVEDSYMTVCELLALIGHEYPANRGDRVRRPAGPGREAA
jgi:hypothetical protein